MSRFEQELKKNNFLCSQCSRCNRFIWPPNDFCNKCFGNVTWHQVSRRAKLIEFSSKDNKFFCIAEFEGGIRVMGNVENVSRLQIGDSVLLVKCDYDGKAIFTFAPESLV